MKFLCVSDQIDPLVYSSNAKERFKDIDAVLCAGDLPLDYVDFIVSTLNKPTFFIFGNHNLNEFHLYHGRSADVLVPDLPIRKNITQTVFKSFGHGADYVGFKMLRVKEIPVTVAKTNKKTPLLMAGVSGSIRYNNGVNQYTEFQMLLKLLKLIPGMIINKILYGRYVDIFLTHAPPRHIHDLEDDCHKGFKCYNWFIKKFSPQFMVHGHIHLYDSRAERETLCGRTNIVNAFGCIIIDMPESI
ncbi:metallophosphoesterase [Treponema parvum]|uniref:metallophosphoesterase n=1 Tax=Treponema parvum TaxID=138851 RepID=UPI001AEC3586|nr:metallophosphoesterase [Treponema parvum]QTQ16055.1 metallophosphoesterase [Treponema parvum]